MNEARREAWRPIGVLVDGVEEASVAATARHSRAATAYSALGRLRLPGGPGFARESPTRICVAIVGADGHEGECAQETAELFSLLARCAAPSVSEIHLMLVGPNVRETCVGACGLRPAGEFPAGAAVDVSYHPCAYHELDDALLASLDPPPCLLVAYNAGVWGYGGSWVATARAARAPLVVTAYSFEEADEDLDCLEAAGLEAVWGPEENDFASLAPRRGEERYGNAQEALAENEAWLCVRAGRR